MTRWRRRSPGPRGEAILGRIVHNWPLKLAAVGLATLMYGGLALSQNTQTFPGASRSRSSTSRRHGHACHRARPGAAGSATSRRASSRSRASTFVATIDLAGVERQDGVVTRPDRGHDRRLADPGPRLRAERRDLPARQARRTRRSRSRSSTGRPRRADARRRRRSTRPTVDGLGSRRRSSTGRAARADVTIQPTGIDVDQDVELIPVDKLGDAVSPVDVTPATARVRIPVFTDQQDPDPAGHARRHRDAGAPASRSQSITIDPLVVTRRGRRRPARAQLDRVDTGADLGERRHRRRDVDGRRWRCRPASSRSATQPVRVTITLRPVTATRTFDGRAPPRRRQQRPDLRRRRSTGSLVTIGGSTARPRPAVGRDARGGPRRDRPRPRDVTTCR